MNMIEADIPSKKAYFMEEEICLPLLVLHLAECSYHRSLGKGYAVAYLLEHPSVLYTHPTSQPSLAYSQAS